MVNFLINIARADYVLPDASSTAAIAQQGIAAVWANLTAFLGVAWLPLIALAFIIGVIYMVKRYARIHV